jgi:elongation factor P
MDPVSFDQINVSLEDIHGKTDYLHTEGKYIMIIYEGVVISVQMPKKLSLIVRETGEGSKGNTATNAMKPATLETGLIINVPLFIKQGDKIVINAETNEYFSKEN